MIAKDISKSLVHKLAENPPIDNFIYSSKIREYVTQELKQRNQNTIAESYAGYNKNNVTSIKENNLKIINTIQKFHKQKTLNQNSLKKTENGLQKTRITPYKGVKKQENLIKLIVYSLR